MFEQLIANRIRFAVGQLGLLTFGFIASCGNSVTGPSNGTAGVTSALVTSGGVTSAGAIASDPAAGGGQSSVAATSSGRGGAALVSFGGTGGMSTNGAALPSGGTANPSLGGAANTASSGTGASLRGGSNAVGGNGSSPQGGSNAVGGTSQGSIATAGGVAGGRLGNSGTGNGGTGNSGNGNSGTGNSGNGGGGGKGSATGGAIAVAPGIAKDSEGQMALSGLTTVSYEGLLNGESFQQEGIISYKGYQYTAFWNTNKHVVMARRSLPNGAWSKFEFTDYDLSAEDAHNTISLGISPGDGTLHLAFDHHSNDLHYRRSQVGFLTDQANANWGAASFSAVTSALVGSNTIALVTYPRFVIGPGGKKMLLSARIGTSGSGDEYLWEYDSQSSTWSAIGKYLDGTSNASATVNAYLHGLSYTRNGRRLHAAWCWRETPDATTNHDLFYAYSDDDGRTWMDNDDQVVARSGSSYVTTKSLSAKVWTINQNRGLINQEHMVVDSIGRVHVLLGHMPDALADDSNFKNARTKSQYFHYWRDTEGKWARNSIANLPVVQNFRGKLAIASTDNLYAVLPDLRIAGAAASNAFANWALLDASDSGRFFSDPLIDSVRLESENKLTIFYPQKSSPNIWALDYSIK